MTGPDDLDEQLSALGTMPVEGLPGAAMARARGSQRTTRSRVLLSAAGSVAVVALAGVVVSTGGEQDRVVPLITSTTPPSASAAPTPSAALAWEPEGALLRPTDTAAAERGSWVVAAEPTARLLDPCAGGTRYPQDAAIRDSAKASLETRREAGGTVVQQEVYRYASAQDAAEALAGYRRAVEGCPTEPSSIPGTSTTHEVVPATDALHVRVGTACETCVPYPTYISVVQVEDGLVVIAVGVGEDGDPGLDFVRRFVDVAEQRLQLSISGTPTP